MFRCPPQPPQWFPPWRDGARVSRARPSPSGVMHLQRPLAGGLMAATAWADWIGAKLEPLGPAHGGMGARPSQPAGSAFVFALPVLSSSPWIHLFPFVPFGVDRSCSGPPSRSHAVLSGRRQGVERVVRRNRNPKAVGVPTHQALKSSKQHFASTLRCLGATDVADGRIMRFDI